MLVKKLFSFAIVLGMLFFVACNNAGKGSAETADSINKSNKTVPDDAADFMTDAAIINMEEIELGNMAQQQAYSQRVKDFGKMLVKDHTNLRNKVRELATSKNIALPDSNAQKIQKAREDLMKSDNFDQDFIDKMVDGHKKAIDTYQKALDQVSDQDIKQLISTALPQLQTHLDSAQAIQESLQKTP